MYRSWPPITESDEVIEKDLADANIPCLMASLAHLSGDVGLLDGDIRPDTENPLDFQCGITPEQQARARTIALEALGHYRDGGCQLPPPLSDADLGRVLHFVAGQPLSDDYVEFLSSEIAIRDADPYDVPGLTAVSEQRRRSFEAVIIGAGLSGILTAYRLKQAGIPVTVVEKSAAVGGTWWDNQYPEARVDTPSHSYAYSIEPYDWPQPLLAPAGAAGIPRPLRDPLRHPRAHPVESRGERGGLRRDHRTLAGGDREHVGRARDIDRQRRGQRGGTAQHA